MPALPGPDEGKVESGRAFRLEAPLTRVVATDYLVTVDTNRYSTGGHSTDAVPLDVEIRDLACYETARPAVPGREVVVEPAAVGMRVDHAGSSQSLSRVGRDIVRRPDTGSPGGRSSTMCSWTRCSSRRLLKRRSRVTISAGRMASSASKRSFWRTAPGLGTSSGSGRAPPNQAADLDRSTATLPSMSDTCSPSPGSSPTAASPAAGRSLCRGEFQGPRYGPGPGADRLPAVRWRSRPTSLQFRCCGEIVERFRGQRAARTGHKLPRTEVASTPWHPAPV